MVGTVFFLAHIISSSFLPSHLQKIFPEALLVQILNAMMHPDAEAGITAHQIFTVLLIPASKLHRHELNLLRSGYLLKPKMLQSKAASSLSSATALLDKLRREKDSEMTQHHANDTLNDCKGKEPEEEFKQGRGHKNSPNFYRLTSIIDRTARSVISLDTNGNQNSSVRFFQLPLSLRNMSMEHNYGTLPPSCERSLLTLATGMMMFMAKIYNIPALLDFLKSLVPRDVDPYLGICDDLQVYVKPHANIREFGSTSSQQAALYALSDLRVTLHESERAVLDILVKCLPSVIGFFVVNA
ncbi:hypothetical protein Sjap_006951 [Stephania japonica]|uniref:Uncharacterized protein n=1 Tax=Stephania japonica TaxID=461633 RepID=A0AAP0K8K7_9MAGN